MAYHYEQERPTYYALGESKREQDFQGSISLVRSINNIVADIMRHLFTLMLALSFMGSQAQSVYKTEKGTKVHTHKDCQYIKGKEVKTLNKEQAKAYDMCKRCKSKDEKKGAKK